MIVEFTCKICRQPGVTHAEDDCNPVWIEKLTKMLTCNRCHDLRQRKSDAEEKIKALAMVLENKPMYGEAVWQKLLSGISERLPKHLQEYIDTVTDFYGGEPVEWSMYVCNTIIEDPAQWRKHLYAWKEAVRKEIKARNDAQMSLPESGSTPIPA